VLDLEVLGESTDMARVAARLDAIRDATQVRIVDTVTRKLGRPRGRRA